MFCGWRLIKSKPSLLTLGSGTLEIDAITGQCVFQGKTISQLTIAEEIRAWLQQDLATNKIPIETLTGARLVVKLSFSAVPWNEPTTELFYSDGKAISTEQMNRCVMECGSNVTTDESIYRSKLTEVQEWPLGWPNSTVCRLPNRRPVFFGPQVTRFYPCRPCAVLYGQGAVLCKSVHRRQNMGHTASTFQVNRYACILEGHPAVPKFGDGAK